MRKVFYVDHELVDILIKKLNTSIFVYNEADPQDREIRDEFLTEDFITFWTDGRINGDMIVVIKER